MDDKAKRALDVVMKITPLNIRSRTDASEALQISFADIWSRHGAQAARYSLLPHVYDGHVMVLEGNENV